MEELVFVFDHDISLQEAAMRLTHVCQGSDMVVAFSTSWRNRVV